jgi:hypothetical protein
VVLALLAGAFLVAVPLLQGRLYGIGQIVGYVVLAALLLWLAHWCQRTLEVGGNGVRLVSPIRSRRIPLEGLRVEVRRGWWTRIVLIPDEGFQSSYIEGLWSPDPLPELRRLLPEGAVTEERTPTLSGPGPVEEE